MPRVHGRGRRWHTLQLAGVLLGASVLAVGGEAGAQSPSEAAPPPPAAELPDGTQAGSSSVTRRYGGQVALGYAGTLATLALSGSADNEAAAWSLFGLALAIPPFVHLTNENSTGAVYSLIGAPTSTLVGVVAGAALVAGCRGDECIPMGVRSAVVGGALGFLAWATVDAVFLAEVEVEPETAHGIRPVVTPLLSRGSPQRPSGVELTGITLGVSWSH